MWVDAEGKVLYHLAKIYSTHNPALGPHKVECLDGMLPLASRVASVPIKDILVQLLVLFACLLIPENVDLRFCIHVTVQSKSIIPLVVNLIYLGYANR